MIKFLETAAVDHFHERELALLGADPIAAEHERKHTLGGGTDDAGMAPAAMVFQQRPLRQIWRDGFADMAGAKIEDRQHQALTEAVLFPIRGLKRAAGVRRRRGIEIDHMLLSG